jgi:hypothetical protein
MGNSTLWRLDGGDNIDYMGNANLPFPFPDAVWPVQRGGHGAGRAGWYALRAAWSTWSPAREPTRITVRRLSSSATTYIDATNFYATCTPVAPATTCIAKDKLHQNQYGGTIGGPLSIPHFFNGKDKLFFFAGYQYF